MSAPATYNMTFVAGDDHAVRVRVTGEDGTPTDVSGSTWRAQIRAYAAATSIAASFTVDTTDAASGVIVLNLTDTVTAGLGNNYVWSLERTIGGVVTTILEGRVTVRADVTRS